VCVHCVHIVCPKRLCSTEQHSLKRVSTSRAVTNIPAAVLVIGTVTMMGLRTCNRVGASMVRLEIKTGYKLCVSW
jgi:hypothetical protein